MKQWHYGLAAQCFKQYQTQFSWLSVLAGFPATSFHVSDLCSGHCSGE